MMRLFHFSDDPGIQTFVPRPVRALTERRAGFEWLNGPLVWAIDERHQPMYLFPRQCPRILLWAKPETKSEDRAQWFGDSKSRMIAFIEQAWLKPFESATFFSYELPADAFEEIRDAGMWISRGPAESIGIEALSDLPTELRMRDVELRVLNSLAPLKNLWRTSLHASGIRLRNATDWGKPATA